MSGQYITDAAAFFAAATLAERDVPVPGGARVRIRELSVGLRGEFAARSREEGGAKAGAWLVSVSCLRENGFLMFSPEDVERLTQSSPRIVEYLAIEIMRHSGLLPAAGSEGGEGND